MTDLKYVRESFTEEQITQYAQAWGCTYKQAERELAKNIVDQAC